jgi:hypothetical protein
MLDAADFVSIANIGCTGVDSAWEQEKLEARKMLENAARPTGSPTHQVRYGGYSLGRALA